MEKEKETAIQWVEDEREQLIEYSREIWGYAELGLEEYKSAALLVRVLLEAGFQVEEGVSDMPTAFVATWGEGRPDRRIVGRIRCQCRSVRSKATARGTDADTIFMGPARSRRRLPRKRPWKNHGSAESLRSSGRRRKKPWSGRSIWRGTVFLMDWTP